MHEMNYILTGIVGLFKRLGNIPRLDDLKHGIDMLSIQLLVVLPRNTPCASDGVFDLFFSATSVRIQKLSGRTIRNKRTWRPFMTCDASFSISGSVMRPSARSMNIFQMARRAGTSRSG